MFGPDESVSPLDALMLRWVAKAPDRCQLAAEYPPGTVTVLTEGLQPVAVTGKKTYRVYAPHIGRYVNLHMPGAVWSMEDWKTVNVGVFVESQPTTLAHLAIAVVEALKAEKLYPSDAGLPLIESIDQMYPTVYLLLEKLVQHLERNP